MPAMFSLGAMLFFIYYSLDSICKNRPSWKRFGFGIAGMLISSLVICAYILDYEWLAALLYA